MVTAGITVGAIQVVNKHVGTGVFDEHDRELLEGLAAIAAPALRNAQLHVAETRAHDLALILEISREITATLDLDRVLQSVVNLASRALTFDRGAVGLYDKGKCEIRAVAGQEKIDPEDPALRDLVARAEWAAGRGEALYLSDTQAAGSDAERMFLTIFGPDLESSDVRSALYLPLRDEEGVLGVLMFESSTADFASPSQRELAAILANQTAVALRNAQLYHQVPMVDALGALAAKKQALLALPRRRAADLGRGRGGRPGPPHAGPLAAPGGRSGAAVPANRCQRRSEPWWTAWSSGSWSRKGARVARGDAARHVCGRRRWRATGRRPLPTRQPPTAWPRLAASRGDAAEERLHRIRAEGLRRELALLDEEVKLDDRFGRPSAGVVLTPRLAECAGTSLAEGDLFLLLGRTDTLELEFGVDQREITRVRPGQEVRLRVDALPQRTFSGTVTSIAPLPRTAQDHVEYPVRAAIANPDGLLRPEMAAHARVLTDPASAATRLFREPVRWVRLAWWRLWS